MDLEVGLPAGNGQADLFEHGFHFGGVDNMVIGGTDTAVDAVFRRLSGAEMQVGTAFLQHVLKIFINQIHG